MTLDQVNELTAYWSDHPPAHLLIAGYLGFKAPVITKPSDLFTMLGCDPDSGGTMRLLH